MIGWDLLALGLPASEPGVRARSLTPWVELPGRWLDRGVIDAADKRLLDSPLGWAGQRVLATSWFATGSALPAPRREALLAAARSVVDADPLRASAGATAVHDAVIGCACWRPASSRRWRCWLVPGPPGAKPRGSCPRARRGWRT